jgi:hypothetical protein
MALVGPLGIFALYGIRRRSIILRGTTLALALAFVSTAIIGCDSSSSSGKDQSQAPPTAPVTTNIMINATAGSTTHSIPVALTVN